SFSFPGAPVGGTFPRESHVRGSLNSCVSVIVHAGRAVSDFLFYGDTERSYAMRHELPVVIGDPFLLAIVEGRMHVAVSFLDRAPVAAAAPDAVLHDFRELGFAELRAQGLSWFELDIELASRTAKAIGLREAIADPEMPFAIADRLRSDGILLRID